jgi:DNA polymerase-3 subunit delta'
LELDRLARALAEDQAPPRTVLASTVDGFRGGEGASRFALFMDRLAAAAAERAKSATGEEAQRWAELWDRLAPLAGRVEALNLDRADAFWTALSDVGGTVRQTC